MNGGTDHARRFIIGLGVVSLLLGAIDLLYKKHPHVVYEAWFNFYGFFALVATAGLLVAARVLKIPLSRDEDFYDG